jgi:hypothetical protein
MSRISLDPYLPKVPCFCCGKNSTLGAVWRGFITIVLCSSCAWAHPQPLAALLADAIADSRMGNVGNPLRDFDREYWRALALALIWERRMRELEPTST